LFVEDRVCADAAIADHWCICQEWKSMEVSDVHVKAGAQKMVDHINGNLNNKEQLLNIYF
jgi:quinol monooxygenase YgiN